MNNVTITLKKQQSVMPEQGTTNNTSAAPNTGAYTSSNHFSHTNLGDIVGGATAVFAVAFVISFIIYQAKKHNSFKSLTKIFAVTLITTFALAGIMQISASANNSGTNSNTNIHDSLSLSVSDLNLELDIVGKDNFAYAKSEVKVNEATRHGYHLSAYTTTPDLVNSKDNSSKISSIITTPSMPIALGVNTWGFALTEPQNADSPVWHSFATDPTNTFTLKNISNSTPAQDVTNVYYGVKANDDLTEGEYKGTIVYRVVANPCPVGNICYHDNGASSTTTMSDQAINITDTEINLWPNNFHYMSGDYGFAGWNTKSDGTGVNYGPNETIVDQATINNINNNKGLDLYANWVASAGSLQNWQGCSTLNTGDVIALTDQRDNNTYAVAKLADNNCWMIENLRLDNTAELSSLNTNNPLLPLNNTWWISDTDYGIISTSNHLSVTSDNWCNVKDSSVCVNQSNINTKNITNSVPEMNTWDVNTNVYSLGNYYNWYSATAGNGTFALNTGAASGDICPAGWRLPYGGTNAANGSFIYLNNALGGDVGSVGSNKLRSYPNNFTFSGVYFGDKLTVLSTAGSYWSSTANNNNSSYSMTFEKASVEPGAHTVGKRSGRTVRCVSGI